MRILSIAFKDLLITLKDKKAMALILLMPIVLIFVLGMGLSSAFSTDGAGIKRFGIALIDEDQGEYAKNFREFFKNEEIKKIIDVQEMTYSEAEDKVRKGDLPAMIVVPKDFSRAVAAGKEANMKVYKDPGNSLKANIVDSLVKSYTGAISSAIGAGEAADSVFKDYKLDGRMIIDQVMKEIKESSGSQIKESNLVGMKIVSAMQYYSAAMLVMYILFVAMIGTSSIIQEREQKTLLRLMGTTVSKGSIITGKLLGLFMLAVIDVSVLIIFTKYGFKTDWGTSIAGLIVLSAAMIFAACGIAMFVAAVFKTSKAVDSVTPAGIMVISFLGGSMLPIYGMPEALQKVARITPNNWALRGYLSLMLDNGINSIITPALVLTAVGIVFLLAGISKLKLQ